MKSYRFIIPLALAALFLPSCRVKTPEAVEQREKWLESLNDSIDKYQGEKERVEAALAEAHEKVAAMVGSFDYVSNPREVEGYYIFNGWKGRYPMQSTALVARVTQDIRFELIATLTGAHFNEIGVSADGATVASEVVPHDQAFNYRAGNLNTVCFYGEKADSIGAFISSHSMADISVAYMEGKRTGSLRLPSDEKQMIARTWELYAAQREMTRLEKELPRLSGRIAACRRMIDSNNKSDNPSDAGNQ
ncbi:MAG: hypothetical protein HDS22_02635 [Bacteroides sp.]|nr:hypothetical protein [Bacteroides sp.]